MKEALEIDKESRNDLWKKAIEKEMTNIKSAFCTSNDNEKVPISYQFIKCYMIFDVKIDFTRKARFVAGSRSYDRNTSIAHSFFSGFMRVYKLHFYYQL